ncbi:hypothetical protein ACKWTF_014711 [Chironomus riparius]
MKSVIIVIFISTLVTLTLAGSDSHIPDSTTEQPSSSKPDFCAECQSIWSSGKPPSSVDCDPKNFEVHTVVAVYADSGETVTGHCVGHLPNGKHSTLFSSITVE